MPPHGAQSFQGSVGVTEVGYEGVTAGEKDCSPIVNQLIAKNPELVFFGGMYAELGIIAKQAREKGFTGRFMGGEGLDSRASRGGHPRDQ